MLRDPLTRNVEGPGTGRGQRSPARRPAPAATPLPDVERLRQAMQKGSREAAAEFVIRYGTRIKRRIRGKLNPAMRRLFDSQDILSTVGRRLDMYVQAGKLKAGNEDQLWSLVFKMANNAVIDKARVLRRLERVEDEDGDLARGLLGRLNDARRHHSEEVEIEAALKLFHDKTDRKILSMWLMGTPHTTTALYVDLAPTAVRKRWEMIKRRLQEHFAGGEPT